MSLQPEIDGFTDRLFNDIDPKETEEHYNFLQQVMTANIDGLSIEEAALLLSKLEQVCIMITTFYILAKVRNENLDKVAEGLKYGILINLRRRAILESPLSENQLN